VNSFFSELLLYRKLASTRVHAILEEDEEEWEEICAVVEATPEIPETELEFELEVRLYRL
jgi:hypothetical protein